MIDVTRKLACGGNNMSKIICGFSESGAIMFSSETTKVTVRENGKVEYREMIRKVSKNKWDDLKYPVKKSYAILAIIEIVFMFIGKFLNLEALIAGGCLFVIIDNTIKLVRISKLFYKDHKLRSNHGAEHMVFNAYRKRRNATVSMIRKSRRYTRYCGSTKLSNMIFLELINYVLALFFGFYIPHIVVLLFTFNFYSALPFNFIALVQQHFITSKPNENSIFMAHLAYELVLQADLLKEKGIFSEIEFYKKIYQIIEEMQKTNDYKMEEVTFIKT